MLSLLSILIKFSLKKYLEIFKEELDENNSDTIKPCKE